MNSKKMVKMAVLVGLTLLAGSQGFGMPKGDEPVTPSAKLVEAFKAKYPEATPVKWEMEKGMFEAKFTLDGQEAEAYFDSENLWVMTKTELTPAQLPGNIQEALKATEYASWQVDDVDRVEKNDGTDLYIVVVKQDKQELKLSFDAKTAQLVEQRAD